MGLIDSALELPIAPSFTRIGSVVRSRTERWAPISGYRLDGRKIAITGATSGIGLNAAHQLAELGANIIVVGRNPQRTDASVESLPHTSDSSHAAAYADMSDLGAVAKLADHLQQAHPDIDTLIHNAGALLAERSETENGIETTVAAQVLGPFLLTTRLLSTLDANGPSRVLTMSSGGMYSAELSVEHLQMGEPGSDDPYKGTEQYARAKRAQVTLNEMWAERFDHLDVRFHSLHPGWVATPGIKDALPGFSKFVGPLLRTPDEGADTLIWLSADPEALGQNGLFWHDRAPRAIHRIPRTRKSDTPKLRAALWRWCVEQTGVDPDAAQHGGNKSI